MMSVAPGSKEDKIRAKAHDLWVEEGYPEGRAEAHWLRAVEIIESEFTVAPAVPAKPKRKAAPRKKA